MSLEEISEIVDNEGLGYAIEFYMGAEEIDDPILSDKWVQASILLWEIRKMLPDV